MRKQTISLEETIKRQQELAGIKPLNESHKGNLSTITYTEKINGTLYGIIKENGFYFIKTTKNEVIKESTDFEYIGGLVNKLEYKYPSYADALKNLNLMKINLHEAEKKNDLTERLVKDINNEGQGGQPPLAPGEQPSAPMPSPEPAPSPAPAPSAEPMPEPQAPAPSPEGPAPEAMPEPSAMDAAPAAEPESGDADLEDDSDLGGEGDDIEHYVGKLTAVIRKTPEQDLSEDRIKSIMNSMISALPLERLSPEERLVLAKRVKRGGSKDDDAPEQQDAAPQTDAPEPEPSPEKEPESEPMNEDYAHINKIISEVIKNMKF